MGRKHLLVGTLVAALALGFGCSGRDDPSAGGGSGGTGGGGGTGGTGGSAWGDLTIYDLQDPSKGVAQNTNVTVNDVIVTAVVEAKQLDGTYAPQHFYVQEAAGGPYSGIYVRNGSSEPVQMPAPSIGQRLKVSGTLKEYYDNTQIELLLFETLGEGQVPAPALVDPEAVATGGADQEKYEGVLVQVSDVKVTERVVPGTDGKDHGDCKVNAVAREGGGLVVGPQATDYIRVPGERLASIVGVMSYSFETSKLVVRRNEDITFPDGKHAGEITEVGPITIRALQDWSSPDHPRAPAAVELEGVTVTAVAGNRVWVQEASADPRWSGILVMLATGVARPTAGDRVNVTGIYTEYYDDSEIKDATVEVVGAGTMPAPARVTPAEIRTGSETAEAYEGVLVEVVDVQNVEDPVNDDNGLDRGDYRVAPIADPRKEVGVIVGHVFTTYYTGAVGDKFDSIVGVLDYSYNEFRLEPRSNEDITLEDGSHPIPTAISVRDLQDSSSARHPLPNSGVMLTGVVVTAVTPGGSFFVADSAGGPYSGVYVYRPSSVSITTPAVADVVTIIGVYKEYFDLTEVEVTEITITGPAAGTVPAPVVLTPDQLSTQETAEAYEGVLVAVKNVQVTQTPMLEGTPEPADRGSFRVQTVPGDADPADDLVIGKMFNHAYTTPTRQLGAVFREIVGVLDYSYEFYRVQPRSNDDMTFDDGTHPGGLVIGDLSVRDLQDPASAKHPPPDSTVSLQGVVVTAVTPTGSFFVSDSVGGAYHGIYVFKPSPVTITVPAVGDVVTIDGTYKEYYDLSQLQVSTVQKTGTTTPPAPTVVPVATLLDPAAAEAYEGCLVKVENVEVTVANVMEGTPATDRGAFRVNTTPDANPADDLVVDDMFAHDYVASRAVGDKFSSIVGVIDYSYDLFRLQPRNNLDITFWDGSHPSAQTGLTIYDVQDTSRPNHPLVNTSVRLEGVVVTGVVTAGSHTGSFFIADPAGGPFSGLYVYRPNGSFTPPALGDEVTVEGTYTEYYNLSELTLASQAGVTITGTATPPAPIAVTPNQIANPTTAEPYEGCLVKIAGVQVTVAADSYGAFRVQTVPGDADPNDDLYVDDLLYRVTPAPGVGTAYTSITGLLDYSFDYFRLSPRGATDLVAASP